VFTASTVVLDVGGATLGAVSSVVVIVASVSLVILSIVMASTAVWLMKANRAEPSSLAPLEVMGEPIWQNADSLEREMILDEVRPDPLRQVGREPLPAELPISDDPMTISYEPLPVIMQGRAAGMTPPGSPFPGR
jgi:hypothetical protein